MSTTENPPPWTAAVASHWHDLAARVLEGHVLTEEEGLAVLRSDDSELLDLLAAGWRIYVAVDAVGSRFEIDYRTALGRMDSAGATLTTTEAALFEWCRTAEVPQFKEISRLVRETNDEWRTSNDQRNPKPE